MMNLVVALPAEAKALIRRYGLTPVSDSSPFRVYAGGPLRLILSGTGKANSAAAAGCLFGLSKGLRNEGWINFGIGGHRGLEIGTGILAHKVADQATGESWYPSLVFQPPCKSAEVLTVGRLESEYREPCVFDMEASGFYAAASRFSTAELVHCYKIISDNAASPARGISAAFVEELMEPHLETVDLLRKAVTELASEMFRLESDPPELALLLNRWHFTATERHQLKRLLKRLRTLNTEEEIWRGEFETLRNAKDVLDLLERRFRSISAAV